MYKQAVSRSLLQCNLPYGFQKRLAFYVAYGSSYFGYNYICAGFLTYRIYKLFYFISNMRNDLDSLSEIPSFPFLVKYIPVNLACGKV